MVSRRTLFVFALLGGILTRGEELQNNSVTLRAYYYWPVSLPTVNVFENALEFVYDYVPVEGEHKYEMTVIDLQSSAILFSYNISTTYDDFDSGDQSGLQYKISNVTMDTPTLYKIEVKIAGQATGHWNVTLDVSELPTTTCHEQNNSNFLTTHDQVPVTSGREYSCLVPRDGEAPLELVSNENFIVYWLFNCGRDLPKNAHPVGNTLVIQDVSYDTNPGIYTCAIEYNGMTRYRIHRRLCVKQKTSRKLSISCSDAHALVGGTIDVMCEVDAGFGKESAIIYHSEINKLDSNGVISIPHDNISCTANLLSNINFAPNTRFSCELIHNEGDLQCFSHSPTPEDIQAQRNRLSIKYTIRNVQADDTGEYVATINGVANKANSTFTIRIDIEPGLRMWIIVLIICLSCLVALALLVILITKCCAIEIKWTWKMAFGAYATDKKQFSAYLAYYYSRDMEESSRNALESFLENFNKTIRVGWGALYDGCREPDGAQYKADNINVRLTECHRVIIILTPEYIRDEWSVYETYEALKNVVENGIPIIFITLPETKAAIQQLDNNAKTALRKALKRHGVINWTGSLPFSRRFQMKLELLMPKLMKVDDTNLNHILDDRSWENGISSTMYYKISEQ